jgi:uncharacterized protein (DUF58 family)
VITRRGWLLLAGAVLLGAAGWLIGVEELSIAAGAAVSLVLLAAAQVASTPLRLQAVRELHPAKVHAGSDSRVELVVRSDSRRHTRVLTVRDPFDGGRRQARFLLAPLAPGELARAAYRLPTGRRGVYSLGPLEVSRSDAFGLASVAAEVAPATQLTVYPRVDDVAPLPHTIGHDPYAGADHPNALGQLGEDFYALRPYVVGDDLRRVHWPSTARSDELMIRQDEMPWQGRATVLLDVRRRAHTGESFELAVSAAASIVQASWARRSLVRLVTTDGWDSGFAQGVAHAETLMEHLAVVKPGRLDRLADVLGVLRRGSGGALAAVTGVAVDEDVDALLRLRGRFGSLVIVAFDPSAWDPAEAARRRAAPQGDARNRTGVLVAHGDAPFAAVWNQAMAAGRARRAAAGGTRS